MAKIPPEVIAQTSQQVNQLVVSTLQQLTRWAFPYSQVGESGTGKWELWHNTSKGERFVDVEVSLMDNGKQLIGYSCFHRHPTGGSMSTMTMDFTYESLNDALIKCVCK